MRTLWQKVPILTRENWIWLAISYELFRAARARPFSWEREMSIPRIQIVPLIEIWGGRFGEKCRFSKENIEFGWPFHIDVFIKWWGQKWWLEKLYQGYLNEMTIKRETTHAWLQNFTWGDLNEHNIFKVWKLIIHGYTICMGAILTKMKNITTDKQIYYLVNLLGWKH